MCWLCCNRSSKEGDPSRKRGKCGMSCLRCNKSSKEEEPSRKRGVRGMCCFCCDKSSKEEEASRKKGKCGIGCFCCNSSSKESSRRGQRVMNCLCCCKSSPEESPRRKGQGWMCCLCCNKSPKEEELRGGGEKAKGCFHCTKSSEGSRKKGTGCFCSTKEESRTEERGMGCIRCLKSPKEEESIGRGERETCCSCCGKSSKKREPSSKRRCVRVMGCSCCFKSPDGKKDNSSGKKRFCWKRKERKKGNNLESLVKSISFKSDSGKHRSAAEEILRIGNGNIAARVFTYRELAAATKNFKPGSLLGKGGFGRVYKGQLEDTNQIVAVKQLDRKGYQGNREFLIEVLMLSLLDHPNLVNLLGYCAEGDQRILVYDYMPLGSLQDHLLDLSLNNKPLDWNTRMKIAAGAAKGLEYLHDIANPPVIYRDFKASNILLDKDFNPKLSDFGLAKLGPVGDKSHISTRVMGTYGYCAPEYALTGQLTKMSDVYSFGVVLLELITGRKAIDTTRPRNEQQLVRWAAPLFKNKKKFVEMADPLLEGKFPVKALYQALAVAAMCLQEEAGTRPLIRDVVTALEYLAVPKCNTTEGSKESVPQELVPPDSEKEKTTSGNNEEDLSRSQSSDWQSCSTTREDEEELKQDVDVT